MVDFTGIFLHENPSTVKPVLKTTCLKRPLWQVQEPQFGTATPLHKYNLSIETMMNFVGPLSGLYTHEGFTVLTHRRASSQHYWSRMMLIVTGTLLGMTSTGKSEYLYIFHHLHRLAMCPTLFNHIKYYWLLAIRCNI
jgi:hypothetical protein